MDIILGAVLIFSLRLIDQTLGTLRLLYVNKGKPGLAAIDPAALGWPAPTSRLPLVEVFGF